MTALAPKALDALAAEFESELEALTAWWSAHALDRARGGFHGEIDARNAPVADAEKGAVLNARLLWFFSAAANRVEATRSLADRAHEYVLEHFLDAEQGGVFWSLDAAGAPRDARKQTYAQAFALYALCAYARMSGAAEPRDRAQALFALMQARCREQRFGGCIEALARDWTPIADMRLSEVDANAPKTMNTHLHVLEAYTALHALAPSPETEDALRCCIGVFQRYIIDGDHLRLFFADDWSDRSEAVSFGHDIEASWLLTEACDALGDAALKRAMTPSLLALAHSCLREAQHEDGGVLSERTHAGHVDRRRVWWVQAEALVGFLNAYELSGDPAYLDASAQVWRFIKRHHRDPAGEWRWWSSLDTPSADRSYKAGFWKGPYHNGRAMIEASRRLRRLARTA